MRSFQGALIGLYRDDDYSKLPERFIIVFNRDNEKDMMFKSNINKFFTNRAHNLFISKEQFISLYDFPFMKNKLI